MVSRILERLFCWRQPDTYTQVVAALALLPRFLKDLAPATYADFVRADGLGVLVGTLRRHPGEPWALACLRLLAETFGQCDSIRKAFGGDLLAGQVAAVVAEMRQHPASADLQVAGCRIMATYFANLFENKKPTLKSTVCTTVTTLLAALRRHPDTPDVLGRALEALAHFVRLLKTDGLDSDDTEVLGDEPASVRRSTAFAAFADGGPALVRLAKRP